jgi:uroporphyrinogen-III synthase
MDPTLAGAKQIHVDELVVYETCVMESFTQDFALLISQLESDARHGVVVVVVFSPSGCEALLRCLGYIDDEKKLTEKGRSRGDGKKNVSSQVEEGTRYIIATIGPTTRDYLEREFGFKTDICAEKPSPEGVGEGVKKFLAERPHVRKVAVE